MNAGTDAGTGFDRHHEADPIKPIVEYLSRIRRQYDAGLRRRQQRQAKKSMGNSSTERPLLGCPFRVNVNPLVIAGAIGEPASFSYCGPGIKSSR
jgi:hypothetical protein